MTSMNLGILGNCKQNKLLLQAKAIIDKKDHYSYALAGIEYIID